MTTHQNVSGTAWLDGSVRSPTYANTTQTLTYLLNGVKTLTRSLAVMAGTYDHSQTDKWGEFTDRGDQCAVNTINCVEWAVAAPEGPFTKAVFRDTATPGQSFDCSSISMITATIDANGYPQWEGNYNDFTATCTPTGFAVEAYRGISAGHMMFLYIKTTMAAANGGAPTTYRNTASVDVTDATGAVRTSSHTGSVTSSQLGGGTGSGSILTLNKTAATTDTNGDGVISLGDRIAWSFEVTYDGTATATGVTVTDPTAGTVTCPDTTLTGGQSTTCTAAPYAITAADVAAAEVVNYATASATENAATILSNTSTTTTPVQAAPVLLLDITKTAAVSDENTSGRNDIGDVITWSFTVTNTGTATVTQVAVTDPTAGNVVCSPTSLTPGAVATCTAAPHIITQADARAGVVSNTASAAGTAPGGVTVQTLQPVTTNTAVYQSGALSLVATPKVTDTDNDGADAGDTITWTYQVTNTGDAPLTEVRVDDEVPGLAVCATTQLAPGQNTTCVTQPREITQADVDAGAISNTAQALGLAPGNETAISTPQTTVTPLLQRTTITLQQRPIATDSNKSGRLDAGDTVVWEFIVTNTGNLALANIDVSDGHNRITCVVTSLAPGATTTCRSDPVTITDQHVRVGIIENTAVAAGFTAGNAQVQSEPATAVVQPVAAEAPITSVTSTSTSSAGGGMPPAAASTTAAQPAGGSGETAGVISTAEPVRVSSAVASSSAQSPLAGMSAMSRALAYTGLAGLALSIIIAFVLLVTGTRLRRRLQKY